MNNSALDPATIVPCEAEVIRGDGVDPNWRPAPDPVIERYKQDVDRTLLRQNLRLTPQQRVDNLIGVLKFIEEGRRAREAKRRTIASP